MFAAILPFSGLGFAYVTPDMRMPSWMQCHIKMYELLGGVTTILTPDNLKTGITKHTRDELVLNSTYQDMAEYYGTVVVPARVRTPRDKNQVENLVYQFEKDVIGRLRNCQFFSIDEYNDQLLREVERFNNKPFQKKVQGVLSLMRLRKQHYSLCLPGDMRWQHTEAKSIQLHFTVAKTSY